MLVPGTNWSTWHSVVSQQTGTICHIVDSGMWQTTSTINFLHSCREWLPPVLSCGQCGSTLSIGVISRFRLCRRSWRLKINIKRSCVHFWKSNICTDQLDVQEANVSVAQLYRIRGQIVGCWFADACTRETGAKTQSTPEIKQVLDQNVDLSNIDQVPSNAHLSKKNHSCTFSKTTKLW